MKESKRIDFTKTSFEANGIKYLWNGRLSLERWQEFEKLQPRLGFGKDFESILKNINLSIDMANKGKGIEAWNIIINIKSGISDKLENRLDTALHIAALFINREDEDLTKVDSALFDLKIKDWTEEGFDAMDFFSLAANLVSGFVEALQQTSLNTLQKEMKESKPSDK
jgi:hypothetical protein